MHSQLCEILIDTPVACILNEVSDEHWIEFYQLYLHDYLRNVHLVTYENQDVAKKEYEVIIIGGHADGQYLLYCFNYLDHWKGTSRYYYRTRLH